MVDYHSRRARLHQMPSAAPCGRRLARRPPREPSGGTKAEVFRLAARIPHFFGCQGKTWL